MKKPVKGISPIKTREIFNQSYSSESLCDVERDVSEAWDERFNDKMKNIPKMKDYPEFERGEFIVTIMWEDNPEE